MSSTITPLPSLPYGEFHFHSSRMPTPGEAEETIADLLRVARVKNIDIRQALFDPPSCSYQLVVFRHDEASARRAIFDILRERRRGDDFLDPECTLPLHAYNNVLYPQLFFSVPFKTVFKDFQRFRTLSLICVCRHFGQDIDGGMDCLRDGTSCDVILTDMTARTVYIGSGRQDHVDFAVKVLRHLIDVAVQETTFARQLHQRLPQDATTSVEQWVARVLPFQETDNPQNWEQHWEDPSPVCEPEDAPIQCGRGYMAKRIQEVEPDENLLMMEEEDLLVMEEDDDLLVMDKEDILVRSPDGARQPDLLL